MGRKPHYGEGSVFERKDGRYEAVVPNFGGTGKRKSFYGATKTEARKKRDEALKQLARDEYVDVSKMKTGEYLEYWISVHGPAVELTTAQSYRGHICVHFIPKIGHIPLQKLSTQDIQHVVDTLLKEGKKASSIKTMLTILKAALSYAVKIGKIAKNPCVNVKLPKTKKSEQTILTADQARQLIDACQDLLSDANDWQLGAILLLLFTTALRIGEALSLHWHDIDMEKRIINVKNTLSYDKEQHVQYEKDPKSESSNREIALSQMALTALSAHRINQLELRLLVPTWKIMTSCSPVSMGSIPGPALSERSFECFANSTIFLICTRMISGTM